jgi:hypothetical protein
VEVSDVRPIWWRGPCIAFWDGEDGSRWPGGYPWWLTLPFALSCVVLGIALVGWPALLSALVATALLATALLATGALLLPGALLAAWDTWKRRPRRIPVRAARS